MRLVLWLERILLFGGATLLAAWLLGGLHGGLLAGIDRAAFQDPPPDALDPQPDTRDWSAGRIAAYLARAPGIDARRVALLEIPGIDLEVAVLDGTGELILNRGVGRIEGTASPGASGNLGIAGHRDGFFRRLERVKPGDLVRITPLDMASKSYRVQWTRVVKPKDIWVLDPTDQSSLTLVTCHPFRFIGHAPDRYIVRATEVPTAALTADSTHPE
jgi:sortase A